MFSPQSVPLLSDIRAHCRLQCVVLSLLWCVASVGGLHEYSYGGPGAPLELAEGMVNSMRKITHASFQNQAPPEGFRVLFVGDFSEHPDSPDRKLLGALDVIGTVRKSVWLREDEVSPDLIKAHIKNFDPHFFLYSSQTWALDPHALEIVFGMCKDLEIISLVFLTRYAWDNVFSSAGEERDGGHSLGGIRLETRYIGVLQAASYVLIVNCGDEARRKMELVGESARLLVL
jgi:hypothetical protein